jgi:DNA-binding FadR family transcriptional regulator
MPRLIRPATLTRGAVFAPLGGSGRAGLVEQRLADAIALGVLANGERLPREADLAQSLGVATVTAREALEALRDKGLIKTVRGRGGGSFVIGQQDGESRMLDQRILAMSSVELRDIGVYYATIGGGAAEHAAEHATTDDVEHLRRIVGLTDFEAEGSTRRSEMNFHLELAALSLSARLVREEMRFQAEIGPILWLSMQDDECRTASKNAHLHIAQAISDVDAKTARRLTIEHITETVAWLIDAKSELERSRRSDD